MILSTESCVTEELKGGNFFGQKLCSLSFEHIKLWEKDKGVFCFSEIGIYRVQELFDEDEKICFNRLISAV